MTQEELKLVLDALKWCHGGEPCGTAEAIAVVEKALAQPAQEQEQEPVDYKKLAALGWQAVECQICGFSAQAFPKPEQEPVCDKDPQGCWSVRCQLGKKCKNISPQRTWVGLTDEDWKELSGVWWEPNENEMALLDWAEAKLKELNT